MFDNIEIGRAFHRRGPNRVVRRSVRQSAMEQIGRPRNQRKIESGDLAISEGPNRESSNQRDRYGNRTYLKQSGLPCTVYFSEGPSPTPV